MPQYIFKILISFRTHRKQGIFALWVMCHNYILSRIVDKSFSSTYVITSCKQLVRKSDGDFHKKGRLQITRDMPILGHPGVISNNSLCVQILFKQFAHVITKSLPFVSISSHINYNHFQKKHERPDPHLHKRHWGRRCCIRNKLPDQQSLFW